MRTTLAALLLLLAACTRAASPPPRAASPSPTPASRPTASPTATPSDDFSLVVIGDFGTGDARAHAVAARVRAYVDANGADALVTTGDNVYPRGAPKHFDRAWRQPYGWVAERGLRVIASLGNHDVGGDADAVMELLDMPARRYATTIGAAEIFVLDGNDPNVEQARWLTQRLRASTAAWQIAVFHQPAYSCSNHDGTRAVVRHWVPVFTSHGVDLVLNGHDHNYQRFRGDAEVTYVVTGGGGYRLYDLDPCPRGTPERVAANDTDHHFVAIDGTATTLRVRAIAEDGATLDDVTLRR